MKNLHRIAFATAAATLPLTSAGAQQIPFQVVWAGDPPIVVVQEPGGPVPLTNRDDRAKVIRGTLPVGEQTVTVQYGDFNLPFGIRVSPSLPRVNLMINHSRWKYCTEQLVQQVEAEAANLQDAINRFVSAGQLLSIPKNEGGCDNELWFRTIVARADRNLQMWAFNRNLYIPNQMFARHAKRARSVLSEIRRRDEARKNPLSKVFRIAGLG